MRSLYLLSYGEVGLKGKNRHLFIKKLISNISLKLQEYGEFRFRNTYGRIFLDTAIDKEAIENILNKSFGLTGYALAKKTLLEYDDIKKNVLKEVANTLKNNPAYKTFKIATRRSNKNFPVKSTQLNINLGGAVLAEYPELKVKLKDPDITINLEVREKGAYLYLKMEKCSGGLPVDSSGKGMLLLSGGIDSPVAAWMMLKRGMKILPIHFFSPPYTSIRAKQKVIDIAKSLITWGLEQRLLVVNFTEIQVQINSSFRKEFTTLFIRKAMVQIAEILSKTFENQALITGENLGQVASQTIESMTATSNNCSIPILRPLIGFDKIDIVKIAEEIDTYPISIQPYDDCCTLFLPDKPSTKPNLKIFNIEYAKLNLEKLIEEAVNNLEIIEL